MADDDRTTADAADHVPIPVLREPAQVRGWMELATRNHRLGRTQQTLLHLTRAIICAGGDGLLLSRIAEVQIAMGNLDRAAITLADAHRFRQDDLDLGLKAVAALSKTGRTAEAYQLLANIAKRVRATNDEEKLAQLARFVAIHGDPRHLPRLVPEFAWALANAELAASAIERLQGSGAETKQEMLALARRPDLFKRKETFYPLSRLLADIGVQESLDWVSTAINENDLAGRAARDPSTVSALSELVGAAPACVHDLLPRDLLAGSVTADTLNRVATAIAEQEPLPEKYLRTIDDGPFAGHPVWHLCNPFFLAWASASLRAVDVQETWVSNTEAPTTTASITGIQHRAWKAGLGETMDAVRAFVQRVGRNGSFLDIGCGFGSWLRLFVEDAGVDPARLFGCDLQESRVNASCQTLRRWAEESALDAAAMRFENRVFVCDLLSDTDALRGKLDEAIDAISLFYVTGCFSDADLPRFLETALAVEPTWVLHATAIDRIPAYQGRPDDHRYFAALGYELVEQHWLSEPLMADGLTSLLLPQKYWLGKRLDIFRKAQP